MNFVEPIKDVKKIDAIKKLLKNKRDILLFTMGINSALRVSDLLKLTIGDVLDGNRKVRPSIVLKERKTDKTKTFPLNESVKRELKAYLAERGEVNDKEPLFPSRKGQKALSRIQAWSILNTVGQLVGLDNIGTHSLRKTCGYFLYKKSGGNLALVQKLLNHSSSGDTLRYIGIDREQMDNAYLELNL
jgi:integrase